MKLIRQRAFDFLGDVVLEEDKVNRRITAIVTVPNLAGENDHSDQ